MFNPSVRGEFFVKGDIGYMVKELKNKIYVRHFFRRNISTPFIWKILAFLLSLSI